MHADTVLLTSLSNATNIAVMKGFLMVAFKFKQMVVIEIIQYSIDDRRVSRMRVGGDDSRHGVMTGVAGLCIYPVSSFSSPLLPPDFPHPF